MRRKSGNVRRPLASRHVPYLNLAGSKAAHEFLPTGPDAVLTVALVDRFRKASKRDPEMKLVVMGTLRAHASNGGDAPLAAAAVLFSAIAVLVSTSLPKDRDWSWMVWIVLGVAVVIVATSMIRLSFAAHARRVVAITWLGAYEDALRRR